jgi:hypothetical protein
MKKIILLLACGAAILCGCNKSSPVTDAKIGALSQKLDVLLQCQMVIYTNESIIFRKIEAVESQVTNSPTADYLNGMNFFYYTNLSSQIYDIQKGTHILVKDDNWLVNVTGVMATNGMILADGNDLIIKRVDEIKTHLGIP